MHTSNTLIHKVNDRYVKACRNRKSIEHEHFISLFDNKWYLVQFSQTFHGVIKYKNWKCFFIITCDFFSVSLTIKLMNISSLLKTFTVNVHFTLFFKKAY